MRCEKCNAELLPEPPDSLAGRQLEVWQALASKPGRFVHSEVIANSLYRADEIGAEQVVKVAISQMRKKGVAIETVHGRGYRLTLDEAPQ